MHRIRLVGAALSCAGTLLCGLAPAAWAQPAGAVRVQFGGRLQVQWNSTSVTAADAASAAPLASSTFETRRARLSAHVVVGDWLEGMLESDFALGELQLKQAWALLELDPALNLRAGQFKKPFGMINLQSSTQLPIIERGLRIRGGPQALTAAGAELGDVRGSALVGEAFTLMAEQGYASYDLGAAVEGRHGSVEWSFGLFNGNGPDTRDENSGKSLAARVAYTADLGLPVTLGAGWSRRELNWPSPASVETRTGDAFAVDAELGGFRQGWWLLAEATTGDNLASTQQFVGAQAMLSYFHATGSTRVQGIEPAARVSWGDPDRVVGGDAGTLLTPGINLYFFGRNRLMLNWDVYLPEGDRFDVLHAARAQMNLHF